MKLATQLFIFVLGCCLSHCCFGQFTITGKVQDSATQQPLNLATISIYNAQDTTLVTYRLTSQDGHFKVTDVPLNRTLTLVITFSGYDVFRRELISTQPTTTDLGTIYLQPISKTLEEVLVAAERPPVSIRKDTIEFNAASFKTLPTSFVEDLLKKLPGVEVARDGSITANGKPVNRILVEGKTFFGEDLRMATKNLPANIIDKVQLVDDGEEKQGNPDASDLRIGKVINLTLKKDIKKGWFGKVYGGVGTSHHYEGGAIANIYRDTLQVSLLGFSNNVNRSGFTFQDVQNLGGFNRSGVSSMSISKNAGNVGFAINGISFGGIESGVSTSSGGGININHAPSPKFSLFAQYFIGKNLNQLTQSSSVQQFLGDTTISSQAQTIAEKPALTHSVHFGTAYKPNIGTTIDFKGTLSFVDAQTDARNSVAVNNSYIGPVIQGRVGALNKTDYGSYNHRLYISKILKAKKRTVLSIYQSSNYSGNLDDFITEQRSLYYYPSEDSVVLNQLRTQYVKTLNNSLIAGLNYELSPAISLRVTNRLQLVREKDALSLFGKNDQTAAYDRFDNSGYNALERHHNENSLIWGVTFKRKDLRVSSSLNLLSVQLRSNLKTTGNKPLQKETRLLPGVSVEYKNLSVTYSQSIVVPSLSYLSPVPNRSNPYYIIYGNPDLELGSQRRLDASFSHYNTQKRINLNLSLDGSMIHRDVVLKKTIDVSGVERVIPVNWDGTRVLRSNASISKEVVKSQDFQLSFRMFSNASYIPKAVPVNEREGTSKNHQVTPGVSLSLNWKDVVELRTGYRYTSSKIRYDLIDFKHQGFSTHNLEGDVVIRWPRKVVWESNLDYRYASQIYFDLPQKSLLWNAAVTYVFMKGDRAQLKLSVFDLLRNNVAFEQSITQTSFIEQRSNVLEQFGFLTFSYNIHTLGPVKKVGGGDSFFRF